MTGNGTILPWVRSRFVAGIVAASIAIALSACKVTNGSGTTPRESRKEAKQGMFTYNIGRFSIDVPAEMKEAARTHQLRYAEIEEFIWPQGDDRQTAWNDAWKNRLIEINNLEKSRGDENNYR